MALGGSTQDGTVVTGASSTNDLPILALYNLDLP